MQRDRMDAEKAKKEFVKDFSSKFGYVKSGKHRVMEKPHDVARRCRSLKQEMAYWDKIDSEDEE
jgi:hypothetical protein